MFLLLCAVVLVLVLDLGVPIIVNDDALVFELALAAALALHETEVRAICPNLVSVKNSRYCSSWPLIGELQNLSFSKFPSIASCIVASGELWIKHFPSVWDCRCFCICKQLRANVAFACTCGF